MKLEKTLLVLQATIFHLSMNRKELARIYRAKRERRKQLAALPIEEKVRIIEQLQELGLALLAAREKRVLPDAHAAPNASDLLLSNPAARGSRVSPM